LLLSLVFRYVNFAACR